MLSIPRFLAELDREYGPLDDSPEEVLHLLQSEGLLEDVQVELSDVQDYLEQRDDDTQEDFDPED